MHRSELSGIYYILCVVEELCSLHNIESGSITIGCDNEKCLCMTIDKAGPLSPKSVSFELLSVIRSKICHLPVIVCSHWVEQGHQNNYSRDYSCLDIWARFNIEMDSLAKLFWEDSNDRQDYQQRLLGETHIISVRGTQICSSLAISLYSACEGHKLKQYWQERKNISASCILSINWAACAGAAQLLGISLRFWKTKHVRVSLQTANGCTDGISGLTPIVHGVGKLTRTPHILCTVLPSHPSCGPRWWNPWSCGLPKT
jgi:hypothetical protein